ncbi:hypothetical protein [Nocardia blacklockiae]|uniref:hypothetical protein n=1 Tax=Nocardia blacklockiae TaxID=480036 RepID=UPI0018958173|nr:hypothetical protein [Nocardia blacklockiae]MBF6171303.1 hypothetical protein [Nocardia blacklockiae]
MDFVGGYARKDYLRDRLDSLKGRLASIVPRQPKPVAPHRHALKRRVSQDERTQIVAKYEGGTSSNQLVADHKLAKGTILKILREDGASMRRQGLTEQQVADAADFYRAGRSLAWIGDKLGFSPTTVGKALTSSDVMLRDPHGRERCTGEDRNQITQK